MGLPPSELLARALTERRRSARLPYGTLWLHVEGQALAGAGDVSVGGALWKGPWTPRLAHEVLLELRLPPGGEVRVPARVCCVHALGPCMAVHLCFTGRLPPGLAQALARLVDDWFLVADVSGLLAP